MGNENQNDNDQIRRSGRTVHTDIQCARNYCNPSRDMSSRPVPSVLVSWSPIYAFIRAPHINRHRHHHRRPLLTGSRGFGVSRGISVSAGGVAIVWWVARQIDGRQCVSYRGQISLVNMTGAMRWSADRETPKQCTLHGRFRVHVVGVINVLLDERGENRYP